MNWKKWVCIVLVMAIGVVAGLVSGSAIVQDRNAKSQKNAVVSDGNKDIGNPDYKKTPLHYSAMDNFLYANGIMMRAKSVETELTGVNVGKAAGISQTQNSGTIRKYDGKATYVQNLSLSPPGAIKVQNVGNRMYHENGAQTVALSQYGKDGWGAWESRNLAGENSIVGTYGATPRTFIPYIVNDKTIVENSASTVLQQDGTYLLSFDLTPAAADNYRYHVWYMSGSTIRPEYQTISYKVTIDRNWLIQKIEVVEVYNIKMKVIVDIPATCTGTSTEIYRINTQDVDISENQKP